MIVLDLALPDAAGRDVRHFFASAIRANDSIGPSQGHKEFNTGIRIGEMPDSLNQGLRELGLLFHGSKLSKTLGCVKYIIAKGSTLAGIDGLYWYRDSLLGVEYGAGSHRVVRWHLSEDGRRVTSTQLLEYRTPLVSFPTTGALAEGKFYYIANTGIGNLDHDKIIDPAKLEPIHIGVVKLR